MAELRGVITDWGGVMTNPIAHTVNAWLTAEGISRDSYVTVMRQWVHQAYADGETGTNPIHALERGECSNDEFELTLARELVMEDGGAVPADGLLARMFAGSTLDEAMLRLFRKLHADGVPTGLLSNSWGSGYPTELFSEMFDAVVISSEVGMRKPEPRIFLHAAGLLGLEPQECVFIDDIQANIAAAEQLGFTGVLHDAADGTAERVAELLQVTLD
ncbi:MAG TPA: HAD family phosphatase [Streptosporangiaceae bacterium]|nr:HAD family phosphatase [Streptosporangiaceae bacterium]